MATSSRSALAPPAGSSGPCSDEAGGEACRREREEEEEEAEEERKYSLRKRAYLPVRSRMGSLESNRPSPLDDAAASDMTAEAAAATGVGRRLESRLE